MNILSTAVLHIRKVLSSIKIHNLFNPPKMSHDQNAVGDSEE
jgi:hypothetical protein